jgi:hypothetical protein
MKDTKKKMFKPEVKTAGLISCGLCVTCVTCSAGPVVAAVSIAVIASTGSGGVW